MADQPLVSAEEVASVLSGGGTDIDRQEPAREAPGDGRYSLRRPVAIAPEAEAAARARIERLSTALAAAMAEDLETQVEFGIRGFQQQPTSAAMETIQAPAWVLSFQREDSGGVALVLDPVCALTLVEIALGGQGGSTGSVREPTPLEARVMSNLGKALLRPLGEHGGVSVSTSSFGVGAVSPKLAAPGEMVGTAILDVGFGSVRRSALLLVTADLLRDDPPEHKHAGARRPGPLARGLERVTVEARPVLEAGHVSLHDLTALTSGAVLAFEVPESHRLELRVAGRPLFRGTIHRDPEHQTAAFAVGKRRGPTRTKGQGAAQARPNPGGGPAPRSGAQRREGRKT